MADDFPQGDDEVSSTHAEWHTSDYPTGTSPSGDEQNPPEIGSGTEPDKGEPTDHGSTDDSAQDDIETGESESSDDIRGNEKSDANVAKAADKSEKTDNTEENMDSETDESSTTTYNKKSKASKKVTKSRSKRSKQEIEDETDQSKVESEDHLAQEPDGGEEIVNSGNLADADNSSPAIADTKSPQEPDSEVAPQQNEPEVADNEGIGNEYVSSPQEPKNDAHDLQDYGTASESDGAYNPYTAQPGAGTPLSPQPGTQNDYSSPTYGQSVSAQPGAQELYGSDYIGAPDKSKSSDYKGLTPAGTEPAAGQQKEEGFTEYNYTQNEQGGKARILIVIGLVVVLAIILLLLLPRLTSHSGVQSTKSSSTTTIGQSHNNTGPSTTTIPNGGSASKPYDVVMTNVDDIFNYTGPSTNGQTDCNYASHSQYLTYSNIVNSSTQFTGSWVAVSGACPLTIEGIYVESPGFGIVNINPGTPITLPPNSNLYFSITLTSPKGSYDGPLTFLIRED